MQIDDEEEIDDEMEQIDERRWVNALECSVRGIGWE